MFQVIYEYLLKTKLNKETLKDNFDSMIQKVSNKCEWSADSELDKVKILEKIFRKVTPALLLNPDKKITPLIDLKDVSKFNIYKSICNNAGTILFHVYFSQASEAEGPMHIRTSHNAHAPCLLVTTSTGELGVDTLSRCYVKMYNTGLGTIDTPRAFEVALLLLATYFIGDIQYPDAYKSMMRFLERFVHGGLSGNKASQKVHVSYTVFVKFLEL